MGIGLSFLPRIMKREKSKKINVTTKVIQDGCCPNCGGDQWYEGPSGGMSVNVECAKCSCWFNNTPFGLQFIYDHTLSRAKHIKWGFCETCKKMFGYEFFLHSSGMEFPKCDCGDYIRTCWQAEGFPKEECEKCEIRFKCYTER